MEYIFINTCTQTPGNLAELARGTVRRGYLLVSNLPALLSLSAAVAVIVQRGFGFTAGLLIVAALALAVVVYAAPLRLANKAAKRNRKKYGCDVSVTLRFSQECVKAHNEQMNTDAEIPYERIERVIQSKNLYLLVLREKMALMVAKDGFSKGTAEKFISFMRDKCEERVRI